MKAPDITRDSDDVITVGGVSMKLPSPINRREPLPEPACVVFDNLMALVMAAVTAEYVDESLAAECRRLGLVEYKSDSPSDVGVLNYVQPLKDAVFHSRRHREKEAEARMDLSFRITELQKEKAANKEAKKQDRMDMIYSAAPAVINDGLFGEMEPTPIGVGKKG